MFNWIQLFLNHYNSFPHWRYDEPSRTKPTQEKYLAIYEKLKKRHDENFKLTSISADNKRANTIAMKLRLIIYLKLDAKPKEITQNLLEAILKMFQMDFAEFGANDDNFIQFLYNFLYYEATHRENNFLEILQYVFQTKEEEVKQLLTFKKKKLFIHLKLIHSVFRDNADAFRNLGKKHSKNKILYALLIMYYFRRSFKVTEIPSVNGNSNNFPVRQVIYKCKKKSESVFMI